MDIDLDMDMDLDLDMDMELKRNLIGIELGSIRHIFGEYYAGEPKPKVSP